MIKDIEKNSLIITITLKIIHKSKFEGIVFTYFNTLLTDGEEEILLCDKKSDLFKSFSINDTVKIKNAIASKIEDEYNTYLNSNKIKLESTGAIKIIKTEGIKIDTKYFNIKDLPKIPIKKKLVSLEGILFNYDESCIKEKVLTKCILLDKDQKCMVRLLIWNLKMDFPIKNLYRFNNVIMENKHGSIEIVYCQYSSIEQLKENAYNGIEKHIHNLSIINFNNLVLFSSQELIEKHDKGFMICHVLNVNKRNTYFSFKLKTKLDNRDIIIFATCFDKINLSPIISALDSDDIILNKLINLIGSTLKFVIRPVKKNNEKSGFHYNILNITEV